MQHLYLFTLEIVPLEVGKVYDDLPSHLTLMSRFLSELSPRQVAAAVQDVFAKSNLVAITFGGVEQLGPKKTTAYMISSTSEMALHDKLHRKLSSLAVEFQYPDFNAAGHKAHVSTRQGVVFEPGRRETARAAYLIEVIDNKRVIRAKFELGRSNTMPRMTKPLIVYVSGAPGSGKTTLAKLLAEQLYIPHVSSDLIHGGVAFSQPKHDRKQTLQNIFVPTMIDMAQKGISFVVDHVLQKGVSEADIIDKLRPHAAIVNVHTVCVDPIARYVARTEKSVLPSVVNRREHLLGLADAHANNLHKTSQPLDIGQPAITVDTNNGYAPNLNEIVDFIRNSYTGTHD
ncbi:MAG: AAA family ATPase [Candidatus Saccharibacteria bacterium]